MSAAAPAADQLVRLTSDPNSAAMRAAFAALRTSHPGESIRLTDISAALVNLVDGAAPQLLVEIAGGYCGSGGCNFTLYERGTTGWLVVNDWLAGSIAISPHRAGIWHDLVLNHAVTWEHRGERYTPAWSTSRP